MYQLAGKLRSRTWPLLLLCLLLAACGGPRLEPLDASAVILAFGDSLTHGTGAPAAESYPSVLAGLTGFPVVNGGVPGEVSGEGRERLPGLLARHGPDLVLLVHGGNDTLRKLPEAATRANLQAMIESARAAGAQVLMLGVPGRSLTLSAPAYYAEVAEANGVPIDTGALPRLLRQPSLKSDPVHLNGKGYRQLAEAVRDLMRDAGAIP